jgi:hypothetical protein
MLVVALAKHQLRDGTHERDLVLQSLQLPGLVDKTLKLNDSIQSLAKAYAAAELKHGPLARHQRR